MLGKQIFLLVAQLLLINQALGGVHRSKTNTGSNTKTVHHDKFGTNTKALAKKGVSSLMVIHQHENGQAVFDAITRDRNAILLDEKAGETLINIVGAFKNVLQEEKATDEISKFVNRFGEYLVDSKTAGIFEAKGTELFNYLASDDGPKNVEEKMESLINIVESKSMQMFLKAVSGDDGDEKECDIGVLLENLVLSMNMNFLEMFEPKNILGDVARKFGFKK